MRINIQVAADILALTEDELLMEAQQVDELTAYFVPPTDMIYNDDGTVRFDDDGDAESTWEFEMDEVLAHKKVLDEKKAAERDAKIRQAVREANEEMIGD